MQRVSLRVIVRPPCSIVVVTVRQLGRGPPVVPELGGGGGLRLWQAEMS